MDPMSPAEAAAALAKADSSRTTLTAGLVLPSHFYSSIGAAITVQIATAAVSVSSKSGWYLWVLIAGVAMFLLVGSVQLWRFRTANGVWVAGMASRVVGGTANTASVSYALALVGAMWASLHDLWWLVAICSVLGGVGYVVSGRRWWRAYQDDPAANARAESTLWLAILGCTALVGLVALVIGS